MGSYHIHLYVCTLEYSEGSLYHFLTEHIVYTCYSTHTVQSVLLFVCSAIPALPSLHLDYNLVSKTANLSAKTACMEGASCDGDM